MEGEKEKQKTSSRVAVIGLIGTILTVPPTDGFTLQSPGDDWLRSSCACRASGLNG